MLKLKLHCFDLFYNVLHSGSTQIEVMEFER